MKIFCLDIPDATVYVTFGAILTAFNFFLSWKDKKEENLKNKKKNLRATGSLMLGLLGLAIVIWQSWQSEQDKKAADIKSDSLNTANQEKLRVIAELQHGELKTAMANFKNGLIDLQNTTSLLSSMYETRYPLMPMEIYIEYAISINRLDFAAMCPIYGYLLYPKRYLTYDPVKKKSYYLANQVTINLKIDDFEKDSLTSSLIENNDFSFYLEKNKQLLGGSFGAINENGFMLSSKENSGTRTIGDIYLGNKDSIIFIIRRNFTCTGLNNPWSGVRGAKQIVNWYASCNLVKSIDARVKITLIGMRLTCGTDHKTNISLANFSTEFRDNRTIMFFEQVHPSRFTFR